MMLTQVSPGFDGFYLACVFTSFYYQINGVCMSPTCVKQKRQHPPELRRTKSGGQRKLQKAQSVASVEEGNNGSGGALHYLYIDALSVTLVVSLCFVCTVYPLETSQTGFSPVATQIGKVTFFNDMFVQKLAYLNFSKSKKHTQLIFQLSPSRIKDFIHVRQNMQTKNNSF